MHNKKTGWTNPPGSKRTTSQTLYFVDQPKYMIPENREALLPTHLQLFQCSANIL
jgi:hypothetical protein